jgi:hypothetical protein
MEFVELTQVLERFVASDERGAKEVRREIG